MLFYRLIQLSILYAVIVNGYLFIMMRFTSPRVWGYSDFPAVIQEKVAPQTPSEKRLAWLLGLPWFAFTFGYPVFAMVRLKAELGGSLSFWTAFAGLILMAGLATLGDLIILDWLIVTKITPDFVVIPGSDPADYKDFSHHFRAHARAAVIMLILCFVLAGAVTIF